MDQRLKGINLFYLFFFIVLLHLYMLLFSLLLIPLAGVFLISTHSHNNTTPLGLSENNSNGIKVVAFKQIKVIGLTTSIVNLFVSLVVFMLFNFSTNQFQFVEEYHKINSFDFYLGVDGLSVYFVLLTTMIIPISLLSN